MGGNVWNGAPTGTGPIITQIARKKNISRTAGAGNLLGSDVPYARKKGRGEDRSCVMTCIAPGSCFCHSNEKTTGDTGLSHSGFVRAVSAGTRIQVSVIKTQRRHRSPETGNGRPGKGRGLKVAFLSTTYYQLIAFPWHCDLERRFVFQMFA
jgi:hypothetical protein